VHSRMVCKKGIKNVYGVSRRVLKPEECASMHKTEGKHRYLMPLDNEMRQRILPLAKPYPKRAGSDTKDTAGHHPAEGGSTPTPALHPPQKQTDTPPCPS
jgi:hypothetical protein